jgi:hypothetical protein
MTTTGKATLPSNIKSEKWNCDRNKLKFLIIHGEGKKVIPSNPMLVFWRIASPTSEHTSDFHQTISPTKTRSLMLIHSQIHSSD